jgi:NTP pyrophosphatase (non-canonical NTP hydrolase)
MLVRKYAVFVGQTSEFSDRLEIDARDIAIQGLASEIGSIVSAIKKEALREGGAISSPLAKAELSEEIGDAIWYAFALARIISGGNCESVLLEDISTLRDEIDRNDAKGKRIRGILPEQEVRSFFKEAEVFELNARRRFSDYQQLAYRTARTHGNTLLIVCAAILTQLGAQLMRYTLPASERELHTQLSDRPIKDTLGKVAWHLCAIASSYGLDMDDVALKNYHKVSARHKGDKPTPLHDTKFPAHEQIPREFVVEFRSLPNDVCQMYWLGEPLGDPLKDQYVEGDGYRFHDVMHLANAAVLGWSPVLRDLMGIKRKSCPDTKQKQDGGRSAVVEELVVKYIHYEGARRSKELQGHLDASERTVFPEGEEIPFSMLKQVREFTTGHEVYSNKFWEWKLAVREGYRVFQKLRQHKGGTVIINLNDRKLTFEKPRR